MSSEPYFRGAIISFDANMYWVFYNTKMFITYDVYRIIQSHLWTAIAYWFVYLLATKSCSLVFNLLSRLSEQLPIAQKKMLLHERTTSGSVRIFLKRKATFSFCILIQFASMSNCLAPTH